MLEIENITELPFDSKGETKLIVIDKYDYNKFIQYLPVDSIQTSVH